MDRKSNPIIVSIKCLVYNHEPYLRDCLNGFIMQKTNFRFEAIVHDDCSTDHSRDIIREYAEKYPNIIKPVFEQENQYSKHDGSLDKKIDKFLTGKYIAMCEGDDYWVDPLKLQKQVDFMETHPEYSLCTHDFKVMRNGILDENSNYSHIAFPDTGYITYTVDNYFGSIWYTQSLTALIRATAFFSNIPIQKYKYYRDTILFYYILRKGKGALLKDCMGVYRRTPTGVFAGSHKLSNLNILYNNYVDILKIENDKRTYKGIECSANDIIILNMIAHNYRKAASFFIKYYKIIPISYAVKSLIKSLILFCKICLSKYIKFRK